MKTIKTTILRLPDGSSYQWFPVLPGRTPAALRILKEQVIVGR